MSKPEFVYVNYIETTPERLWAALIVRLGEVDQHERDDRHGDVDPEDRAPGPLDEVAACERADRRQAARARREPGEASGS